MSQITLGNTNLVIEQNGFGGLPIQRLSRDEAAKLLQCALDGGMNYFDTARNYSDSEEKMGYAFAGRRGRVVLATKSHALTGAELRQHLEQSLRCLGTDYIDVYQFHNPPFCPKPGGEDGLYDAALAAKAQGKIRFISITNHRLAVAQEAVASGLYATLQFPYSYLAAPQEQALVERCTQAGMGFVAMKGMAGGLIRNGYAAAAFMTQQAGVVPIWGVQHQWELDQFLACVKQPPTLTPAYQQIIDKDKKELSGGFCRGCGYCMPCPVGIEINMCARMSLMLRRAPAQVWLSAEQQVGMEKITACIQCGQCRGKCPYGLDVPKLLQENYRDYQSFLTK